jgi:hypothetical protein
MTRNHTLYTSYQIVNWRDCFVSCLLTLLRFGCAERHSQTSVTGSSILDRVIGVFHCILIISLSRINVTGYHVGSSNALGHYQT